MLIQFKFPFCLAYQVLNSAGISMADPSFRKGKKGRKKKGHGNLITQCSLYTARQQMQRIIIYIMDCVAASEDLTNSSNPCCWSLVAPVGHSGAHCCASAGAPVHYVCPETVLSCSSHAEDLPGLWLCWMPGRCGCGKEGRWSSKWNLPLLMKLQWARCERAGSWSMRCCHKVLPEMHGCRLYSGKEAAVCCQYIQE